MSSSSYRVLVIGAGHAGLEAAFAAERLGASVCLITKKASDIGQLSCNPSIGGVGKGIIVKEIDALDGVMPKLIDSSCIHFKNLNSTKGPAVWGPRAQADRSLYSKEANRLLGRSNIELILDEVMELKIEEFKIKGVVLKNGGEIFAKSVVVATGTFLNGVIHIGDRQSRGGRFGDESSIKLANSLYSVGFKVSRLKTGTPARLDRYSIDYTQCEAQQGEEPDPFSSMTEIIKIKQVPCHVTYTNSNVHNIITENLHLSSINHGIKGVGPRYCPSIEDKVNRFADKERHKVFLEPEGIDSDVIYPNGISTSLPQEVQEKFIRKIAGLEKVKILKYGYAIEYNYISPLELNSTLETKKIKGLFLAGQINGTTGYEEAAGQGLIAGANAVLLQEGEQYTNLRSDSYIGVMINDLIVRGVTEPYRMMTSRAEYRIVLRPENASQRLTEGAYKVGLVKKKRYQKYKEEKDVIDHIISTIKNVTTSKGKTLYDDLTSFEVKDVKNKYFRSDVKVTEKLIYKIKVEKLYEPYLSRQKKNLDLYHNEVSNKIPSTLEYSSIKGLSSEILGKLEAANPKTIADAKKIEGMTPSAIVAIQVYLRKNKAG